MSLLLSEQTCQFSGRPKYDVWLKKPNVWNLDWVFSVPRGQIEATGTQLPLRFLGLLAYQPTIAGMGTAQERVGL